MSNTVQAFRKNPHGRDFVCSDIHGHYDLFIESIQTVNFNSNTDRVFCVGDLIDRGPQNLECLELLLEPWFFSLRGNHEEMMISSPLSPENTQRWLQNGGQWHKEVPESTGFEHLVELASELPIAFELENQFGDRIGVCHAQCPTDDWREFLERVEQRDSAILADSVWGRRKLKNWREIVPVRNISFVVAGHTIVPEIARLTNQIWIETGAAMGKHPTVLPIDELHRLVDKLSEY